jgi:hypothetical protein
MSHKIVDVLVLEHPTAEFLHTLILAQVIGHNPVLFQLCRGDKYFLFVKYMALQRLARPQAAVEPCRIIQKIGDTPMLQFESVDAASAPY